ncbi:tRNA (uracil-5-)-methyltransferase homolog A-like isoform X1 [Acropora palmata]|uniref:tRNA (uracil-5-)-methyltransferase homolog A-like isoform X1 n=2 Tax=Acropora palmata TaxID=6131 RepID=UPI003DA14D5F
MAEGEDMAKGDPTKEPASLSSDQNTFPIFETKKSEQEVSSSIPGFPSLFQFAKLQTEASSWTANASDNSAIPTYEFEEKQPMIQTELSTTKEVSWEENSVTINLSATNGADSSILGESSGLGSVSNMQEKEMVEAEDNEMDKEEEKVGEEATANDEPDEEEAESDPYFYTKRDEFTSEIYKIELQNLPKKCGYKQFKKMIANRLNVRPVKVKLPPGASHAYVTFRNEEERRLAIRSLSGHKWKGKVLSAKTAQPLPDPLALQRAEGMARKRMIQDAARANVDAKRIKLDGDEVDELAISVRLNHVVTPLWDQPYSKQMETKKSNMVEILGKLTRKLKAIMVLKNNWVEEESAKRNGICCELLDCVESPVLDGYRNKCEFTIAEGPDRAKTVGFRLGSYKEGYSGVVEPSECIHISDKAKVISKAFQTYVRQSPLPVYDLCFHTGYWQTLTVRSSMYGETMAVLQFSPQKMTKDEIEAEKNRICEYFKSGEGKDVKLTSLYLQINHTRAVGGNAEAPFVHIMGEEHIYEELCGLKFRISPDSFFQVNTKATEKLFNLLKDWCGDHLDETVVLDICCGTGALGLCLAQSVKRVIGVEIIENAVEDAKANAQLNGVTNAQFVCGKAEDIIVDVFKNMPRKTKIIGIMDPPRAGLHQSVLHAIRKSRRMDKLIYVSCNPSAAFVNFLDLCRPTSKRIKTAPFRLVKAVPVDLFPHTKHCELLLLFERDMTSVDAAKFYKWYY